MKNKLHIKLTSFKCITLITPMAKRSIPVYRYAEVQLDKIVIPKLNKDYSQPACYLSYQGSDQLCKPFVQSGTINITQFGIPKLTDNTCKNNFFPDDSKREYIKVPIDPSQPACVELKNFIQKLDDWASSVQIKTQIFGKYADKYLYSPALKAPKIADDEDDEEDETKKKPKPTQPLMEFVKLKFGMNSKGGPRTCKTVLWKVKKDQRTKVTAETITDVAQLITYRSDIRFVFSIEKIWANKTAARGATHKLYGLGFTLMVVEFTPSVGIANSNITECLPSDELVAANESSAVDLENGIQIHSNNVTNAPNPGVSKTDDNSDTEELPKEVDIEEKKLPKKSKKSSPTNSEEIEEPVKEKKTLPKKSKKQTAIVDDSSNEEDEDSEEEIPVKKQSSKKSKIEITKSKKK